MPAINWGRHHQSLRARFGPRIAVQDAQGCATYAEIADHAAGLARALLQSGAGPGTKIASLMRNSRLAVAASYAIQLTGAAEVPLNIAYTEAERRDALTTAGCTTVVCAPEHAQFFRDHAIATHDITTISPQTLTATNFPDVPPHFPGRIGFTSGTTGRPKAIVTSQQARFTGNLLLQASLPWLPAAGSRCLLMTPFAHGASLQSFAWLNQGGTVILHDGVDPDRIHPLLASGTLEAMFAAPTVLAKLTAAYAGQELPPAEAMGIRTIFTGTAPLPPQLYARTRAMFGPIVRVTYGKSEVVNPIAILRPDETDAYFAESTSHDGSTCVGWPGQGVEIRIDGDEKEGEILLRAQHMSDGILDANHNTIPWREDGFHPTGDIGRIDQQGRLHLVARLSDAMKSGGYKIYPQEIERAAAPAGDTVIIGFPSEYWGEIIVAVAENPPPNWEEATRAACADLAPYKRPRFYATLTPIPRNGQGKIVRRHIIAALQQKWRLIDGPRPSFAPLNAERLP